MLVHVLRYLRPLQPQVDMFCMVWRIIGWHDLYPLARVLSPCQLWLLSQSTSLPLSQKVRHHPEPLGEIWRVDIVSDGLFTGLLTSAIRCRHRFNLSHPPVTWHGSYRPLNKPVLCSYDPCGQFTCTCRGIFCPGHSQSYYTGHCLVLRPLSSLCIIPCLHCSARVRQYVSRCHFAALIQAQIPGYSTCLVRDSSIHSSCTPTTITLCTIF